MTLLLLLGCQRKGGGTVRHGDLSYNATEVFGAGTPELALAEAAGRGDANEINRLVSAGANVNMICQHEITPLWWAAWNENYEGFSALLDKGANPNAQRKEGLPVMHLIANRDDARLLEAALKHGADPNLRDNRTGETLLFPAIEHGRNAHVELLLAAKADVNAQWPISHLTLPMVAMSRANYRVIYRLLECGADPFVKAASGSTLATYIEKESLNIDDPWRTKVIEFLKGKGIVVKEPQKN